MLYIAENLKALRKEKDMTQEEVAEMIGVSAQSVSKWERGETYPDITLLPAIANLFEISTDSFIGMDKINDSQAKNAVYETGHKHMRGGDNNAAVDVFAEALKIYPNDEGLMSELAIALALDGSAEKMKQAIDLCERVLSNKKGEKVHHTTRAALCFIYLKHGEKEKAFMAAHKLPHIRESRETIVEQLQMNVVTDNIDTYLRFLALSDDGDNDIITIEFGTEMVPICTEHDLLGKIKSLRSELGAPSNRLGHRKLPEIRIRDYEEFRPGQLKLRYFADVLIDKDYAEITEAVSEIIETLRKIAKSRSKETI